MPSEQKRLQEEAERVQKLSAQDRYNARAEQLSVENLSKGAEKTVKVDEQTRLANELEQREQMGDMDAYEKYRLDSEFKRLADFLEVSSKDFDDGLNALRVIMEWSKDASKSNNILDALTHLKKVRNSLGYKEVGLIGLKKLYQYARLDMDEKRIHQEKQLLKERF